MADNVDITPGTGKTVATDEVSIDGVTAHVQRVKPVHGIAGSAVDTSAADPLPVTHPSLGDLSDPAWASGDGSVIAILKASADLLTDVKEGLEALNLAVADMAVDMATVADDTSVSEVAGLLKTVQVTPTVVASPDYTTGMAIGGIVAVSDIARAAGKTGYIASVEIMTKILNIVQIDAFFFNASPAGGTTADQGTFTLASTDFGKLLGVVKVDSWVAAGAAISVGYKEARIPIYGQASDDLYMILVARGTLNLGSTSDITVAVTVDQN